MNNAPHTPPSLDAPAAEPAAKKPRTLLAFLPGAVVLLLALVTGVSSFLQSSWEGYVVCILVAVVLTGLSSMLLGVGLFVIAHRQAGIWRLFLSCLGFLAMIGPLFLFSRCLN